MSNAVPPDPLATHASAHAFDALDKARIKKLSKTAGEVSDTMVEILSVFAQLDELRAEIERQQGFSVARKAALQFALQSLHDAVLTEDGLDGADGMRAIEIVEEAIEHGTFDCLKRGRPPRLCLMEDYDRAIEQREEVGKALLHFRREVEVLKRDAADLAKVIERGGYCLTQMMNAYERRIRSDCTPEQIEKRPWECAEYVEARAYLCTMFAATDADADRG